MSEEDKLVMTPAGVLKMADLIAAFEKLKVNERSVPWEATVVPTGTPHRHADYYPLNLWDVTE